jgi:catechol 2,3-dioxygenase-like lactoylglutathione lyase family enzyme
MSVRDVEATGAFCARALGMTVVSFGEGRRALAFGAQKINLHRAGAEIAPRAARPTPGSADLCLIASVPLEAVAARLAEAGVAVELGPVRRTGATGSITSLQFRDPDGSLIEVSRHDAP